MAKQVIVYVTLKPIHKLLGYKGFGPRDSASANGDYYAALMSDKKAQNLLPKLKLNPVVETVIIKDL